MAKASEWSERVALWRASGLRAEEFCKGKPFSTKSLWAWSSQLQRKAKSQEARLPDARVALARVVRVPEATHSGSASVVFVSAKGRLELRGRVDPEIVRAMVEVLASGAAGSSQ